jgi:hypothetical protein
VTKSPTWAVTMLLRWHWAFRPGFERFNPSIVTATPGIAMCAAYGVTFRVTSDFHGQCCPDTPLSCRRAGAYDALS